jgi:hypothetical protein
MSLPGARSVIAARCSFCHMLLPGARSVVSTGHFTTHQILLFFRPVGFAAEK